MTALLVYVFCYFFFALTAVLISQKLGLGSVLGYLLAGILIGPVLGIVGREAEAIQHIAEFGVVMMLFLVGLELAPQMLWQMRHKLLGMGSLQIGLTLLVIMIIAIFLGYSWQIGVVVGCILSLSSTAIVLQTFTEKQLLSSPGGQAGFAVLLFQDVAAIPMLALLPLLSMAQVVQTDNAENIASKWLQNQSGMVIAGVSVVVIVLIITVVRYCVPHMFRLIANSKLYEMFTIFTLAVVVGIAALMQLIGLSPALGAFIAGVALANSSYCHEMESHLEPFKSLFLGLFFITVGASMNFSLLMGKGFFPIIGVTLALLLIKSSILWCLAKVFRLPSLSGQLFALSLAQAGEFGFVLLSIANQHQLLPTVVHDRMTLVVALSMLLTPLLFIFYEKILSPRAIEYENTHRPNDVITENKPVILLGHGRFGQQISSMLMLCGFSATIIDNHAQMVEGLTKYGMKTYYGDATSPELLNVVGLHQAKLLIVCVGDVRQSTEIVEFVRRNYPHVPIIARAHDRRHAFDLNRAGANYIIRETIDSAIRAGRIALEQLGLSHQQAQELSEFYAARDRYQLEKTSELYDPQVAFFDNDESVKCAQRIDAETKMLMMALIRGEKVDWHENPNSWVRVKKGISSD